MESFRTRYLQRGDGDDKHRISLGVFITPDVNDDQAWHTIVTRGIVHYDEWSQNVFKPHYRVFALSYKHTEHNFGKLSRGQADELRTILNKYVGGSKTILWVDCMYMMREGLGLQDFSSEWVRYGLLPYEALPVIRLEKEWNRTHAQSNKRSGWLWLERTLGRNNKGVYTVHGLERVRQSGGMAVSGALRAWLEVQAEFGFRPDDETAVRREISGQTGGPAHRFQCRGGQACIGYLMRKRDDGCNGRSGTCNELAKRINGTFFEDKLILTSVGRIAEFVVRVDKAKGTLERIPLSTNELQPYTRILASREHPFQNVRWLGLENFA